MKNGIFIQDLQYPAFSLKRIKGKYIGVSSFYGDPLLSIPDPECQKIYDEATWKRLDDEYNRRCHYQFFSDFPKIPY